MAMGNLSQKNIATTHSESYIVLKRIRCCRYASRSNWDVIFFTPLYTSLHLFYPSQNHNQTPKSSYIETIVDTITMTQEIDIPLDLKRVALLGAEETKLGDKKGAINNTEKEIYTSENTKTNLPFI